MPEQQRKDVLLDIADVSSDQRRELNGELIKIFGSPAHPTAKVGELEKTLKLDEETLKEGSTVYRQQCLHCHGLSGDGRGATAPWVNPHPRDYRQGIFKFTSSGQEEGRRK
ncbi:MAG: cytochrome c, partial [Planctomycetota bacterium]